MSNHVGLIIPSSNRMVEEEMVHYYPAGTVAHVNRLRMTGAHKVPIAELMPRITEATAALADAGCNVVTFHCTANSTDEGTDGEAKILEAMSAAGVLRVSSTATAIRRALKTLGSTRMVLITPYTQAVTDHEAEFFRALGIEVLTAVGHDLGAPNYAKAPPEFWTKSALSARHREADIYLLSCANIAAMSVIKDLEAALGCPVITSNQTVLWDQVGQHGLALDEAQRRACPGSLSGKPAAAAA